MIVQKFVTPQTVSESVSGDQWPTDVHSAPQLTAHKDLSLGLSKFEPKLVWGGSCKLTPGQVVHNLGLALWLFPTPPLMPYLRARLPPPCLVLPYSLTEDMLIKLTPLFTVFSELIIPKTCLCLVLRLNLAAQTCQISREFGALSFPWCCCLTPQFLTPLYLTISLFLSLFLLSCFYSIVTKFRLTTTYLSLKIVLHL